MYKIIGGDQKEYGPISADDIRRWIAEGRLNAQSWARLESGTEWKALSNFPEFAEALNLQAAGRATPPVPTLPAAPHVFASQALGGTGRVEIGDSLSRSFALLKGNFGLFYTAAFIICILNLGAAFTPFGLGLIFYFLFKGILYGGLYLVFLKRVRGEPASLGDLFAGFRTNPVHLVLAGVVTSILVWIGTTPCCLILPGVYLFVAWILTIPLVIDRRLEFWSAMELSRKTVTRVWFEMLGLVLLAFLPYVLAATAVRVKIFLSTFPLLSDVMSGGHPDVMEIFRKVSQISLRAEKEARPLELVLKGIWFLNWPFAVGALMYAYENLFGPRKSPSA
jgi:uncharacterized membrane protein